MAWPKQPHRNTLAARQIRLDLLAKHGNRCAKCGATDLDALEFDHIHGVRYRHNEMSYLARMIRYRREDELEQIRVLCGPCNRSERKTNDNGQFIPTIKAALVPLTTDLPF